MKFPKRVKKEIREDEEEIIEKTVQLTYNKNQFVARIPRGIEEFLEIKKGDKLKFIIKVGKTIEESEMEFKIVRE